MFIIDLNLAGIETFLFLSVYFGQLIINLGRKISRQTLPLSSETHVKTLSAWSTSLDTASINHILIYNPENSPHSHCNAVRSNSAGPDTKIGLLRMQNHEVWLWQTLPDPHVPAGAFFSVSHIGQLESKMLASTSSAHPGTPSLKLKRVQTLGSSCFQLNAGNVNMVCRPPPKSKNCWIVIVM